MLINLITQEAIVWSGHAQIIIVPTSLGEISVLDNHEPLICMLAHGELKIKDIQSIDIGYGDINSQVSVDFGITGGFVEIAQNKVVILADSADRSDEIDELKAQEAKDKAQKLLSEQLLDVEFAEAQASLQKALLHLKIAKRKKKI